MLHVPKIIKSTLSVRLSMMVVLAMALLLMTSLILMLHFSRKVVKEEALANASQTLDGIIYRIDNILLSAEQTTGNFCFMIQNHLDDPEKVYAYSKQIVESNPYIEGCAIAFEPDYYEDHKKFLAYFHRSEKDDSVVVRAESFGTTSYTQQFWYKQTIKTGKAEWVNPMNDVEGVEEPVVSFCVPLFDANTKKTIGVLGVDVSLSQLSRVVLETKPSPNAYCTLLDGEGSYIVHPDSKKLFQKTIFTQSIYESDSDIKKAADDMLAGETGYRSFDMDGTNYYIFFRPFTRTAVKGRSMEELKWYVGIVYPEEDIFGEYVKLLYYVMAIAIIGLLVMFILSRFIMHRQLLPLKLLTASAQRITEGKFDELIPESHHTDEISYLQDNFRMMQQSLAVNIGELEQLKTTLQERGEGLKKAYNAVKNADRMKTAFLHNMTNQMISPAEQIERDVATLCDCATSPKVTGELADSIQKNGKSITKLLNDLISMSEEEMRKEGAYDEN